MVSLCCVSGGARALDARPRGAKTAEDPDPLRDVGGRIAHACGTRPRPVVAVSMESRSSTARRAATGTVAGLPNPAEREGRHLSIRKNGALNLKLGEDERGPEVLPRSLDGTVVKALDGQWEGEWRSRRRRGIRVIAEKKVLVGARHGAMGSAGEAPRSHLSDGRADAPEKRRVYGDGDAAALGASRRLPQRKSGHDRESAGARVSPAARCLSVWKAPASPPSSSEG